MGVNTSTKRSSHTPVRYLMRGRNPKTLRTCRVEHDNDSWIPAPYQVRGDVLSPV